MATLAPTPPPLPPQPLLTVRPRKVEALAPHPRGPGTALAVAASALGGNVWDGQVTVLLPGSEGGGAGGAHCSLRLRDTVTSAAWADDETLCVGGDGGDVAVYVRSPAGLAGAAGGAQAAFQSAGALEYHDDAVSAIARVPGTPLGAALAVASWDGSLSLWDARPQQGARVPAAVLQAHHAAPIHAMAPHPFPSGVAGGAEVASGGGCLVASGGDDCRVHVAALGGPPGWRGVQAELGWAPAVRTRTRVSAAAWACCAPSAAEGGAPAGAPWALLVGQEDGTLALHDLRSVGQLQLPAEEEGAGGGWGDDARAVHRPLATLHVHAAPVRAVAVAACPAGGGLLVASGGDDGAIHLSRLALEPGASPGALQPRVTTARLPGGAHTDYVRALAWVPSTGGAGGLALLSGGWDGLVVRHEALPAV